MCVCLVVVFHPSDLNSDSPVYGWGHCAIKPTSHKTFDYLNSLGPPLQFPRGQCIATCPYKGNHFSSLNLLSLEEVYVGSGLPLCQRKRMHPFLAGSADREMTAIMSKWVGEARISDRRYPCSKPSVIYREYSVKPPPRQKRKHVSS